MEMIVQRNPNKSFYGKGNKVIRLSGFFYPISFINSRLVTVLTVYMMTVNTANDRMRAAVLYNSFSLK